MKTQIHKSNGQETVYEKTARLTITGAGMSAGSVMLGHPLDTIKTYSQSKNLGFYQSTCDIYKNGGVKNFYKGLTPNITRNIVNTTWRVPLTTYGPKTFADKFSMNDQNGKPTFKANIAAAFLFTGPIDVSLSSIFEVAKVNQQTGGTYSSLYKSFQEKGGNISAFSSTYMKGLTPMYLKNAVGYSSLFAVNKLNNDINDKFNPDGQSSYWTLPASAALASVIKVGITNPIDVIKTHKQASGCNEKLSTMETAKHIFKEKGANAFYRGMSSRFVHGFMAANSGLIIMKLSEATNDSDKTNYEPKNNKTFTQIISEERHQNEIKKQR
jgi:hypothetical protein